MSTATKRRGRPGRRPATAQRWGRRRAASEPASSPSPSSSCSSSRLSRGVGLLAMVQTPVGGSGGLASTTPTPTPQALASPGSGPATANPVHRRAPRPREPRPRPWRPSPRSSSRPRAPPAATRRRLHVVPRQLPRGAAALHPGRRRQPPIPSVVPVQPRLGERRDRAGVDTRCPSTPDAVNVSFTFAGGTVTMVVSMVPGAGGVGWVGDDTSCAGGDLYAQS